MSRDTATEAEVRFGRRAAYDGTGLAIRQRAGLSLHHLAWVIPTDTNTLASWEAGRAMLRTDSAVKYGRALRRIQAALDAQVDDTSDLLVLFLSQRVHLCLWRNGITTVGDLTKRTEEDLLDIHNFGAKCLAEVKDALERKGLTLGKDR